MKKIKYKKDLIAALSNETGYTESACEEFLDAFIDCVTTFVRRGFTLQITKFGSFKKSHRKARTYKDFSGNVHKRKCKNFMSFKAGVDTNDL